MGEMAEFEDDPEDGYVPPGEEDLIARALKWMRVSYTMERMAMPDPYESAEAYPQEWTVKAFLDAEVLIDSDYEDPTMDARGRIPVASASVTIIPDVGNINFWDVMDAHSAETAQYGEAFIAAGSPPDRFTVHGERVLEGDLVILNGVEVRPRFRGHRVGQLVLKEVLETLGRLAVVTVLYAAPFLDEDDREGSAEHAAECAALRRYWADVGFSSLVKDFMILPYEDMLIWLSDGDLVDEEDYPEQLAERVRLRRHLRLVKDE